MSALLSKNMLERAGWTLAQAAIALALTELGGVKVWWAAPIAMLLSAIKTSVVDLRAQKEAAGEAGP